MNVQPLPNVNVGGLASGRCRAGGRRAWTHDHQRGDGGDRDGREEGGGQRGARAATQVAGGPASSATEREEAAAGFRHQEDDIGGL